MSVEIDLRRWDDGFVPSAGFRPGIDALPDGQYEFLAVNADFDTVQGKDVIRLGLKVKDGNTFEKLYWLNSQESVNRLGGDLALLQFDVDKWRGERKFSDELPKAVKAIPGLKFLAKKSTSKPKNEGDKAFHNLTIVAVVGRENLPAPAADKEASIPF